MVAEAVIDDGSGVFEALADPTRRWMIQRLANSGSITPTVLAEELPISRQAVSRHLGVLQRGGLVTVRKDGREQRYQLAVNSLRDVAAWIAGIEREWDARLAALGDLLSAEASSGEQTEGEQLSNMEDP
jgi:DNA-binding transcriptional ArsR family regulator